MSRPDVKPKPPYSNLFASLGVGVYAGPGPCEGLCRPFFWFSSDGRHAIKRFGTTTLPESYPSYIAGEIEINGFKIDADDRDTNTVVGVFIGDKQED